MDTFHALDRDGDGFIDATDLADLFASSADETLRTLTGEQLHTMIGQAKASATGAPPDEQGVDAQGTGGTLARRLSFDEFKQLLLQPQNAISEALNRVQRENVAAPGEASRLERSRAAAAKRDAARLFKRAEADETKQGRLSAAELIVWARRHFAQGMPDGESGLETTPEQWVEAVIAKFDKDDDGLLDRAEFGSALNNLERMGWHAPSIVAG